MIHQRADQPGANDLDYRAGSEHGRHWSIFQRWMLPTWAPQKTLSAHEAPIRLHRASMVVVEIRGLLTPPPSREMRVKSEYIHHKEIKGAIGVKLIGNNLEKVMAGTPVMVSLQEYALVLSILMPSFEDSLLTEQCFYFLGCRT